jgi:hypothetical protein
MDIYYQTLLDSAVVFQCEAEHIHMSTSDRVITVQVIKSLSLNLVDFLVFKGGS